MTSLTAIVERAVEIRRDLHRHPELGFAEERTAAVVRRELDRLGIAWRACAGTGTVGIIGAGKTGRRIALRADLDALPMAEETGLPWASVHPNTMHACGHDGHTASLIAAAAYLKSREQDLPGTITLLFQPAEERGAGAQKMVDGGALDEVDEVYGYHNWPTIPLGRAGCIPGTLMAANGEFDLVITGRGGHASMPHEAIDPLVAAANVVVALQQVVSRQINPIDPAVISVTAIQGGTAYNVIPDGVKLMGTVRGVTTALRDELGQRAQKLATAIAEASGCRATFTYRPQYPATVNDPACAAKAAAAIERVLGAGSVNITNLPIMGAEDFAFYLQAKPGCYMLLGSAVAGKPVEPCHSPRFDYNEALIPLVMRLWADLAGVPIAAKA
ncbi:MAG TPA: amidohydrolase [Planctomycetota bacterium]|nr:amidohydrolase [Planctomycetota bacterium]